MEEGLELILERVSSLGEEQVALEAALNRVLFEEIRGQEDLPPFDRCMMDGYAVNSSNLKNATPDNPVKLELEGEAPAGHPAPKALIPGKTMKVMTGSMLPEGADAVIQLEEVKREGNYVLFFSPVPQGLNIDPQGSDIKKGDVLLEKGTILGPPEIGILASQGYSQIPVFKKPKVAILTTGDEILRLDQPTERGKVRDSNSYMLAAAVKEAGGIPFTLSVAEDDLENLKEIFERETAEYDLILSTGGVSMGDYDLVRVALEETAEILFWQLKIKPGKPVVAAYKDNTIIIGLPGNPAAAFLNFYLLARPVISKLQGAPFTYPVLEAVLDTELAKAHKARRQFFWAKTYFKEGEWHVILNQAQGSGLLTSFKGFNSVVDASADSTLKKGDKVKTMILRGGQICFRLFQS